MVDTSDLWAMPAGIFECRNTSAVVASYTVILRINAPCGALFSAKTGKIRNKRPLSKQKCVKRPGHTVKAPHVIFCAKNPGTELASQLSVGDGAAVLSKAGKGVLYMGKLIPGYVRRYQVNVLRNTQRKLDRELNVFYSAFKNNGHSSTRTSTVLACIGVWRA